MSFRAFGLRSWQSLRAHCTSSTGGARGAARSYSSSSRASTVPPVAERSFGAYLKLAAVAGAAGLGFAYFSDSRAGFHKYVFMPIMHLLFDAETSHVIAIQSAKYSLLPWDKTEDDSALKTTVFGKTFSNPIGLAAGFDKNADAIDPLLNLGFGFVEIGTVTPLPQPGNPKPRMFRLSADKGTINRYGFNSEGAESVAQKLRYRARIRRVQHADNHKNQEQRAAKSSSSSSSLGAGSLGNGIGGKIVGINIGKNKTTVDASSDYVKGVEALGEFADYLVINVSSPNTPGLRSLQGQEELTELITKVQEARDRIPKVQSSNGVWSEHRPPILVKIAPDLTTDELKDISQVALRLKVDGLIVSNTTITRPETLKSDPKVIAETGGLSGPPLFEISTEVLRKVFRFTKGSIPLIGVGGIQSGADAYAKIRAGASLVQFYTSMAFDGPGAPVAIKQELAELLRRDGFHHVSDAVGVDVSLKD